MAISNEGSPNASELSIPYSGHVYPPTKRRKLSGRSFYESLGSPKMILAPMVDQSEFVRCFEVSIPTPWADLAI